jgi:signal recognition particle subunit SRP54
LPVFLRDAPDFFRREVGPSPMLEALSKGFQSVKNRFAGKTELSEENIQEALGEIRRSLLEADVEFHVVKKFLDRVKDKAVGEIVALKADSGKRKIKVGPGDHFIAICQKELEGLMGPVDTSLKFAHHRPTTFMMCGLQGSGKTTTTAKLARHLVEKKRRKPLLVAADVYRPAAIDQLRVLGERLKIPVYSEGTDADPRAICKNALEFAKRHRRDTVILDTAGRLAIDEEMMAELRDIATQVRPDNIFLVVDAMIGQDSVRTAKTFNDQLSLDGIILTKLDGDARGGAALSIKEVTGKPIKFLGTGESTDRLEEFRPEGIASRILGFGDIVGLMKDFEEVVDEEKAERDARRMLKGKFDFDDFLKQISIIQQMGSLKDLFEKMPFFGGQVPEGMSVDDRELDKVRAVISSMTAAEKRSPEIIDPSRVKRIARGAGRKPEEVQALVERFFQMKEMMAGLGQQIGFLEKIPGIGKVAQMKRLAEQQRRAMQGQGAPGGLQLPPGLKLPPGVQLPPGMQLPSGLAGDDADDEDDDGSAPMRLPGMPGRRMGPTRGALKNLKNKRKAERKARKANRKRK